MNNLDILVHHTIDNLYKIIDLGKTERAIHPETTSSILSIIDDLLEVTPGNFDNIFFCVACGEDFEAENETLLLTEHSSRICSEMATHTQGKEGYPESICQDCLDEYLSYEEPE